MRDFFFCRAKKLSPYNDGNALEARLRMAEAEHLEAIIFM